jgi:hypothetical protein
LAVSHEVGAGSLVFNFISGRTVDGRMIIKYNLKKEDFRIGLGSAGPVYGQLAFCFEQGNENSDSIKRRGLSCPAELLLPLHEGLRSMVLVRL